MDKVGTNSQKILLAGVIIVFASVFGVLSFDDVNAQESEWNVGEIQWLEASYSASGTGVVRLVDPDMNLDPKAVDNFDVDVWSDSDAGGIDLTMTETNASTGVFEGTVFFSINDESSGHRLRVAEGDTITAEYEDSTLPDPYASADQRDIIATSLIAESDESMEDRSNWALITLDKKIYTWTDTIRITISAPEFNLDSNVIDTIGDSESNPVRIASRGSDLDMYKLVETGPDTGVFAGEVTLTGFSHDADGNSTTGDVNGYDLVSQQPRGDGPTGGFLPVKDNSGVTVSFEFAEDQTVIDSSLIKWNMGQTQWLKTSYLGTGTGHVRVIDPDMNLDPDKFDNFDIDVWSDSDPRGIDLTMTETNKATGIFEGTVFFSTVDKSSGHRLLVAEGDEITAEYEDNTLPEPYTSADERDIIATSFIAESTTDVGDPAVVDSSTDNSEIIFVIIASIAVIITVIILLLFRKMRQSVE